MGYKEEYEATRKTAYDNYIKTIEKIRGDTSNLDSIALNWNSKKNKWDGDNEFTNYQENFTKEPTKKDPRYGVLEKKKLYLVARNISSGQALDDDHDYYTKYNNEYGITHNKPTWSNSRHGIWMELDLRGAQYNSGQWNKLVNQYIGSQHDDERAAWDGSGWQKTGVNAITVIHSGMKIGGKSRRIIPPIKNLDTGEEANLWSGAHHHYGSVHGINDSYPYYRDNSRKSFAGKTEMHNIEVDIDDYYNTKQNEEADIIRRANIETNKQNKAKNNLYDKVKAIATRTAGGDYVKQRDKLTKEELVAAGISNSDSNKILGQIKDVYKDFYRDEKLEKWDNSLGSTPEFGSFDPDYYSDNNGVAREAYDQAEQDDNIDITERYGKNDYMWWHYTTVGKDAGARGNEAEVLNMASEYLEEAPDVQEGGWENQTDADLMAARDKQLGIVDDDLDMVNDVPEINKAWEEAKLARAQKRENYWTQLAADNYLDVRDPGQFASLFRISASGHAARGVEPNEEHQRILDDLVGTDSGITDIEDRITQAVGTQAILNVERFGALNQNVLKDAIEEMKAAKRKEAELDLYKNFGQFNEVLNINETLTNSILGDSGIGGYLGITGDDTLSEDTLKKSISNITGIRNEVVHNWEKWFDQKIVEKYENDIQLGYTVDEVERNIEVQKEFAEDYITDYLRPRFDESRSMSEFTEYLDVRQEEQNPFQTQDILNAVNQVGKLQADSYLDAIRQESDRTFDAEFYFDPTGKAGLNTARESDYERQRDLIATDWENAKNNPNELVDELNPGLGTWRQQAYRFGTDVTNESQFARLHYQIKGQHENYKFDAAEDIVSPGKVKEHIYTVIFPALQDEVARQPHVFGQFIRPEEFADDMLEGIDPNLPDSWQAALSTPDGESLIEGFKGGYDELKQYLIDGMSGNSALDMRQSIKYLNEKKERPTQLNLGTDYIQREEDYKPIDQLKGDTKLFKTFQSAGYEGTEEEFYEDVFPDLDPSHQKLMSEMSNEDGKMPFMDIDMSDPFTAVGSVEGMLGDDFGVDTNPMKSTDKDEEKKDKKSSFFSFDPYEDDDEDDEDDGGYKTKKGQDFIKDFTSGFKFF